MALSTYKRKRKFNETPEPQGGQVASDELRFVVQKHQASRLHYDLRLELKGTLKSWAVPKGPSLDPDDKRLAVQVEDHPYDYKDFEGTIPKGNYGAGTVIVWDEGTYEPLEAVGQKKAQEQALREQWKAGHIKFRLKGKKLKGAFVLIRIKGDGPDNWLLIKHRDRYASTKDVTQQDRSVRSKKTNDQLTEEGEQEQNRAPKDQRSSNRTKKTKTGKNGMIPDPAKLDPPDLSKLPAATFPEQVRPMLSSVANAPFDGPGWTYEVKWDGYRAVAYRDKSKCLLLSRTGRSFETKFPPVFEALRSWKVNAVLDGEIVALNDKGLPDFNHLQNWRSAADGDLHYYVFDLLWLDGKDTMQLPLIERLNILKTLLPEAHPVIKSSFSHSGPGIDFFEAAASIGLEGIIAKRADSTYQPGHRSKAWLKIKARKRQEVVIGGYTKIAGTSRPFSALLLGVYQKGVLHYAGRVGTGFKEAEQKELLRMFGGLKRSTPPFSSVPVIGKHGRFRSAVATDVVWLKPELVCEIHFTEVTPEGIFRHPSFIALREDKPPRSVVLEDQTIMKKKTTSKAGQRIAGPAPQQSILIPEGSVSDLSKRMNGVSLELTNPDKVLWPDDDYTKGDMLNYYNSMAAYILPYLKQRPQSLHRFPNGIGKSSFYQKDVTDKVPDWIELYPYKVKGERDQKHYMLCNNKAALLYMANLGSIELNPWSSTVQRPDHPSWCILDIDPDTNNTFEQVIETAQSIFALLEDIKVPSYCKTSGSTGLHIYIPLHNKYTYDQSQLLAQWVATTVSQQLKFTSVERMKSKRKGKVYIDYLQNRPAATLAAPYSLRPRPGATVSMPLYREEVKKGLKMKDFTIANALDRVRSEGDIFKPVLGKGIDLKKVLEQIDATTFNEEH